MDLPLRSNLQKWLLVISSQIANVVYVWATSKAPKCCLAAIHFVRNV